MILHGEPEKQRFFSSKKQETSCPPPNLELLSLTHTKALLALPAEPARTWMGCAGCAGDTRRIAHLELRHFPERLRHELAAAKLIIFSFKLQPFLVNPQM